jgi:Predicted Zn peptidase
MSSMDDANAKAKELREKYSRPNQPLSEVYKQIFEEVGISVQYAQVGEHAEKCDGKWKITLPVDTSTARDNFTIAHELGHIVLKHRLNEHDKIHRSGSCTTEEIQANRFAAEFLMPKDEFSRAAQEFNFDERKLADKFEVSKTAVLVRMSVLNIVTE